MKETVGGDVIDGCEECEYFGGMVRLGNARKRLMWCSLVGARVHKCAEIPGWCPLPDASEERVPDAPEEKVKVRTLFGDVTMDCGDQYKRRGIRAYSYEFLKKLLQIPDGETILCVEAVPEYEEIRIITGGNLAYAVVGESTPLRVLDRMREYDIVRPAIFRGSPESYTYRAYCATCKWYGDETGEANKAECKRHPHNIIGKVNDKDVCPEYEVREAP
jgi:hypothetical protein